MSEISIRIEGAAGRITLQRPQALNALTYDMLNAIDAALADWAVNDAVKLVIIDAEGDKAFAAGGDIRDLYQTGRAGNFAFGQTFWADEYRLNARVSEFPKPYVALMQGFTMGGGVGVSCHGSHRVVSENAQVSMPECGIGLVPDVGGSLLLANAPGRLGEYLGLSSARMGPADAIYAGFADSFVPFEDWDALRAALSNCGDVTALAGFTKPPPNGSLSQHQEEIDAAFAPADLPQIIANLTQSDTDFAQKTLKALSRNSPLSMSVTLRIIAAARASGTIRETLKHEYRYVFRCMEHGDFLEGIRAAIIDKDRKPSWPHDLTNVPSTKIEHMCATLGDKELTF